MKPSSNRGREKKAPGRQINPAGQRTRRRLLLESFEPRLMMDAIPVLNSLPNAPATLFLDFDGHSVVNFKLDKLDPIDFTLPAFDRDGNPQDFSPQEIAEIKRIWARVAEDYSPFNINVTTSDKGLSDADFRENAVAMRALIGGRPDMLPDGYASKLATGQAILNSFNDPKVENLAFIWANAPLFVIDQTQDPPVPGPPASERTISETVSHEAGHGFNLNHQYGYDANGKVDYSIYHLGDAERGPIMGDSRKAERGVWWITQANAQSDAQDDMAQMVASNPFGYRPDEHGNDLANATMLKSPGGSKFSVMPRGVVNRYDDEGVNPDLDFFTIQVPWTFNGAWIAHANVVKEGPNLDAKLITFDFNGDLLEVVDPANSLSAEAVLGAGGKFSFAVASHGGMGDYGQYTAPVTWKKWSLLEDLRWFELPPLIDIVCDPAGPYPPWSKESLANVTKLVIEQDARLDGDAFAEDGSPLILDRKWRADVFERTAATLDPLLARHDLSRLDVETFERALDALWSNPQRELKALMEWVNLAAKEGKTSLRTEKILRGDEGISSALTALGLARIGSQDILNLARDAEFALTTDVPSETSSDETLVTVNEAAADRVLRTMDDGSFDLLVDELAETLEQSLIVLQR